MCEFFCTEYGNWMISRNNSISGAFSTDSFCWKRRPLMLQKWCGENKHKIFSWNSDWQRLPAPGAWHSEHLPSWANNLWPAFGVLIWCGSSFLIIMKVLPLYCEVKKNSKDISSLFHESVWRVFGRYCFGSGSSSASLFWVAIFNCGFRVNKQ